MAGIVDSITSAVQGLVDRIRPTVQPAAETLGVPITDKDTERALGTPPEGAGRTITGGKRRHRTRRHRKGKKTHKRKH